VPDIEAAVASAEQDDDSCAHACRTGAPRNRFRAAMVSRMKRFGAADLTAAKALLASLR